LSFSLTTLAWGALHYWDAYVAAEEMDNMIDLLLWGGDWLEKATILDSKGIVKAIYVLVGDPEYDHGIWNGPENIKKEMPRPVYKVDLEKSGTDVAADYAAAFAAMGLVYKKAEEAELFKNNERNRTTSGTTEFRKMVKYAEALMSYTEKSMVFGTGDKYSDSVPEVATYYKSWDYRDEVVWGGIWLYRATGKMSYYELAKKRYYNWGMFSSRHGLIFFSYYLLIENSLKTIFKASRICSAGTIKLLDASCFLLKLLAVTCEKTTSILFTRTAKSRTKARSNSRKKDFSLS
jgi:endoglucanase